MQEYARISPSFAEFLKSETRAQHEIVERLLPLFRSDFSLQHYKTLILYLHSLYRDFEDQIEDAIARFSMGFPFEQRKKLPLLEKDLKNLGLIPLPRSAQITPFCSVHEVWGTLYVLEGATHGGQVISKHFKRRLELSSDCLNFYVGYGDATASMWKQFLIQLETSAYDKSSVEVTSAAAKSTFRLFEKLFLHLQHQLRFLESHEN